MTDCSLGCNWWGASCCWWLPYAPNLLLSSCYHFHCPTVPQEWTLSLNFSYGRQKPSHNVWKGFYGDLELTERNSNNKESQGQIQFSMVHWQSALGFPVCLILHMHQVDSTSLPFSMIYAQIPFLFRVKGINIDKSTRTPPFSLLQGPKTRLLGPFPALRSCFIARVVDNEWPCPVPQEATLLYTLHSLATNKTVYFSAIWLWDLGLVWPNPVKVLFSDSSSMTPCQSLALISSSSNIHIHNSQKEASSREMLKSLQRKTMLSATITQKSNQICRMTH